MKHIFATILLLIMLFPAGVSAQGETVEAPPVIDLASSEVSPDIKLAITAVIQRLRRIDTPIQGAVFDPAGQHKVGESGFNFDGFDATGIAITGYTASMLESDKAMAILEGIILFKDFLGRRAGTYFCLQYIASRDGISIVKSVATGLPPDFPRVESFLIAEDTLKANIAELKSFADYYLFVLENAEPMTYGPDEKDTGDKEKYFIITFSKDRLFEESDLKMKVMDKPSQRGKVIAKPVYLSDSGWRFIIAGGKFRPGSKSSKFYVTVIYNQEPKGHLPSIVVGEFENVKEEYVVEPAAFEAQATPAPAAQPAPQPAPQPAAPAPPPVPQPATQPAPPPPPPAPAPQVQQPVAQPAPATAVEGPLASGTAFLNPIFPEDVTLIQKRLQKLGYYNGPIDMEFGPLTKKGLDRYAVRNGFPPGQWSLDLQKTLFKGTGL